jgi:hypothetical protein
MTAGKARLTVDRGTIQIPADFFADFASTTLLGPRNNHLAFRYQYLYEKCVL